jgi:hypothetical protein
MAVWHGTMDEAFALTLAIKNNCDCNRKPGTCTAHQAMLSQHFLDRLLFFRRIAEHLLAEEFR